MVYEVPFSSLTHAHRHRHRRIHANTVLMYERCKLFNMSVIIAGPSTGNSTRFRDPPPY